MRIVLDTNVMISALFWAGGIPSKILDAFEERKLVFCVTPDILDEYTRIADNLSRKYPNVQTKRFFDLLASDAEMYPNAYLDTPASRDGDDDKFIACALEANAKVIVSGDKDLLDLKAYKDIEILTPKQFIEKHQL